MGLYIYHLIWELGYTRCRLDRLHKCIVLVDKEDNIFDVLVDHLIRDVFLSLQLLLKGFEETPVCCSVGCGILEVFKILLNLGCN